MNKTIKRYIITNQDTTLYWVSNFHYGYTTGNKSVFDTRFTDDLSEATVLSKKDAEKVLARFDEFEFVQTGKHKVDGRALTVCPISITYEI